MRLLAEVSLISGPDLADKSHQVLAVAQNVADRFDGFKKQGLGLAPSGPLSGV